MTASAAANVPTRVDEAQKRWLRRSPAGQGLAVNFYMPRATPLLVPSDDGPTGGAEKQIVELARALVRTRLRIGLIGFDHGSQLPPEVDGIRLIGQRPVSSRLPGLRTAELYLRTAHSLWRGRASVFVQRAAGPQTGLVALAAKVLGRRFVYSSASVFDFDYGRLARRRWNVWLFHLGVRLADAVVVQTLEQVELCRARFGRRPVLIRSIAEPAPPRTQRPEAFLWIGRPADYKQPLAYVQLARAVPEARFQMVLVSHGPEVERAAAELPNVTLLPAQPRAELERLMERAVAIVSTSECEGMPNVLLEGWARGVPALVLEHDPDGVIARHRLGAAAGGSAGRLAELVRELWRTRDDQAELAQRCRTYIDDHHSPHTITNQWIDVLDALG